jgi:flagellar capping protein FliD
MKFRIALTSLLALSVLGAVACDDDDEDPNGPPDIETFTADLTGAAERPTPVTTTATGTATFTATTTGSTTTITYSVTVTGLSGPATLAHIHGPADENNAAGPIVALTITGSGTSGNIITGSFTTTGHTTIDMAQLLTHMMNGQTYINIHTAANPDGEIRGQID